MRSPLPTDAIECPLCLGEGTLKRTEILDRLGVKDFARVAQLSAEEVFRLLSKKNTTTIRRHGLGSRTNSPSALLRSNSITRTNFRRSAEESKNWSPPHESLKNCTRLMSS